MTAGSPGGWCTNWSAYNVESIWQMVEGEGKDSSWSQVHSWADVENIVSDHAKWLTAFQAEVDRVWPSTGEASAAFGRQIDMLKASMDQTVVASGRTKHALNDILTNLEETKAKVAKVRDEYKSAESDWKLRQFDHAEDELNEKARTIMAQSEVVIGQRTASIVAPPLFYGDVHRGPAGEESGGSPGSSTFSGGGGLGRSGGGGGGSVIPPVRHDPPAPMPGIDPVMPEGQDWKPSLPGGPGNDADGPGGPPGGGSSGPVLSGTTPPSVIEPPRTMPTPNPSLPGAPPVGGPGLMPSLGPVIGAGPGIRGGGPRGGGGPSSFGTRPTAGRPVSGVIGGTPTGGRPGGVPGGIPAAGRPGGAGAGGRAGGAGRTPGIPPSGVIGGNQGGQGPGGRGGRGGQTPGSAPGMPGARGGAGPGGSRPGVGSGRGQVPGAMGPQPGRRRDAESEGELPTWDPDNPWEVAEGGPGVIEPDLRTRRHDAGPGVIGGS